MSIKQFGILYTSCILIDVASTYIQVCTIGHDNYNSNFRELQFYINLLIRPERGALWEGERWQAIRVAAV